MSLTGPWSLHLSTGCQSHSWQGSFHHRRLQTEARGQPWQEYPRLATPVSHDSILLVRKMPKRTPTNPKFFDRFQRSFYDDDRLCQKPHLLPTWPVYLIWQAKAKRDQASRAKTRPAPARLSPLGIKTVDADALPTPTVTSRTLLVLPTNAKRPTGIRQAVPSKLIS